MNKRRNLKNVIYAFIGQLVVLGLSLFVPRFVLTGYGSDTNGLLSTVGQIIAYMTLLEAGIGQAARNELYRYVKDDVFDKENSSSVMTLSRKVYRNTTKIYALLILVLAVVLPFIIKTDLSYLTVFLVILIEGASSVISFYFVQNYTNILIVDGKQYVNANIDLVFKGLVYAIKIVMALLGVNIILMEIGFFIATLVKIFIYEKYVKKHYGWIDYNANIEGKKLKDRGPYIIMEIAWTVFSSTDMIVISMFCSTKKSSVYAIYYMVFITINKLADAVFTSLKFNLGQIFHKDKEQYKQTHDVFNSVFVGALSALLAVAYYLCIPFITLYTDGVSDTDYIDPALPMGFCLIYLLSWCRMVSEHLIGVAGYAKKLSKVSIIEVVINIVLSVIFVNRFGISGVLYATVIALPLKVIYCNILADRVILKRSVFTTVKILLVNIALFVILASCKYFINVNIDNYLTFFIYGVCFTLCSAVIFLIANVLANKNVFAAFKRIFTGDKT